MKSRVDIRVGLFFECIGCGSKKRETWERPRGVPEIYMGYLIWTNLPGAEKKYNARLATKSIAPKRYAIQLSFITYNHLLI